MANSLFARGGLLAAGLLGIVFAGSMAYGITEEVKFGQASGTVVMEKSLRALPNARVVLQPKFELPDNVKWSPRARTDAAGKFDIRSLPVGAYEVQVYGKAHSLTDGQIVVTERGTGSQKPVSFTVVRSTPNLDLRVSQKVLSPKEEVSFEASGIAEAPALNVALYQIEESAFTTSRSVYELAQSLTINRSRINPAQLPGLKKVSGMSLPIESADVEGAFAESRKLKPLPEGIYLMKASQGVNERFAFLTVTNLALVIKSAGTDMMAFAVDINSGKPQSGVPIRYFGPGGNREVGVTDANGVLKFQRSRFSGSQSIVLGARKGASTAYAWMNEWDDPNDNGPEGSVFVKTDRPIYRPGDTVQYKGIYRQEDGLGWKAPAGGEATVVVKDPDETQVSLSTVPLNRFGTFSGKFETSAGAPPGQYRIETTIGRHQTSYYVTVMPFRKPEYTVTVVPEKKSFRRGESVVMKVKAQYYTGEPLGGAKVALVVKLAPAYPGDPLEEGFSALASMDGSGDYADSLEGRTNAAGEAVFAWTPPISRTKEDSLTDQEVVFEASVADPSERYFTGSGSALLTRGALALNTEFDRSIVAMNEPAGIKGSLSRHEDGKAQAGQTISVSFRRSRWVKARRVMGEWEYEERQTVLSTTTVVSGPDGSFRAAFTPSQAGEYVVAAETSDAFGNRISSQSFLWVTGGAVEDEFRMESSLDVVLDKRKYASTDEVKGVIRAENPGGTALLTVEGKGVIVARTIPLTSKATSFNLGSMPDIAPGAEVKVSYIRSKKYYSSQASIAMDLVQREITVDIKPDRPEAKPGESVTYTLRATDSKGEPVQAELSLGVVDEGIYQIQEDYTNPLDHFFSPRWSQVRTEFSFPEIYLDGEDKAPRNLQIRKEFVDTAFWAPQVQTNADGTAAVTVKLPDNLTSWRATATAVSGGSLMGQASQNLISRKELMARLSPPAFLVLADKQKLGAVITNGTDQEQEVSVRLRTTGLTREGEELKKVRVQANSTETLSWPIEATDLGDAKLELAAWTGAGLSDGLELPVNVRPRGIKAVQPEAGQIKDAPWAKVFTLEPNAQAAELSIRIDPTPLSAIAGSLDRLIDFPYGCTEQTLSRFVPAVAAKQAAASIGGLSPATEARLPLVVKEGLIRMRALQNSSGGWGWFETDEPSTLMTAAALEGLFIARGAGVEVPDAMVKRALDWSRTQIKQPLKRDWQNDSAYLAAAILLYENNPDAVNRLRQAAALALGAKREEASTSDLARMTVDMKRLAGMTGSAKDDEMAAKLYARAKALGREDYWARDYWGEGRGRLLFAMAVMEPEAESTRAALQNVLASRKQDDFGGTRATAIVVLGALELAKFDNAQPMTGMPEVLLNNAPLKLTESKGANGPLLAKVDQSALKEGPNELEIRTQGGRPYVQAYLTRFIPDDVMAPAPGSGISISRTYHRVESIPQEDGTIRREVVPAPIESIKSGEVFRVQITVTVDQGKGPLFYAVVEDPLPSNCTILESSDPYGFDGWSEAWTKAAFYSDKAVFFFNQLPEGPRVFNYTVRAESPGISTGLPASASLFYTPGVYARSAGMVLEVKE